MRRISLTFALLAACGIAFAKPVSESASSLVLKPTTDQTEAAIWAMRFLSRFHYKPMPLDDAMSEKIFSSYLDSLDGDHLFFTQADIDRFSAARDKLDDAIFERDLSAPFAIFNLYQQRVAERLAYSRELLAKPFDFSKDESWQYDRAKAPWAKDATQLDDLRVPPGNRLHALEGDREGQHAIAVNDQWRICFRFVDGDAWDVEICDYH